MNVESSYAEWEVCDEKEMDKAFRRYAIRPSKIDDIVVRTIKLYESKWNHWIILWEYRIKT